jgi:hypothetical protein
MEKTYFLKQDDRYYKVVERPLLLLTRLNSTDPNDIYEPRDSFELTFSLDTLIENGYEIVNKGGKKSRSKKYKKNSKTKRRHCR